MLKLVISNLLIVVVGLFTELILVLHELMLPFFKILQHYSFNRNIKYCIGSTIGFYLVEVLPQFPSLLSIQSNTNLATAVETADLQIGTNFSVKQLGLI